MGCYIPGRGFGPCRCCDDESELEEREREIDEGRSAGAVGFGSSTLPRSTTEPDYEVGLAW